MSKYHHLIKCGGITYVIWLCLCIYRMKLTFCIKEKASSLFSQFHLYMLNQEECQDLYQIMTNGLLKKPTILELEQKTKTLHEDRMKWRLY
ncbi:SWIB/MDM2, Plus-3 and GYF domain-containing protein [Trifolium repens]|nr:SWIB/MDM2, Plus-3 and GYF domain-containing protein [Trifolium repens]